MYIVAIAWIYVVLMMSVTEQSFIAGIMTFLLYGLLPLTLILYLMGVPERKRRRLRAEKTATQAAADPADASPERNDDNDIAVKSE